MTTVAERLENERETIRDVDKYLASLNGKITEKYLADLLQNQAQFVLQATPTADESDSVLNTLSLSQLNQRNDKVEKRLSDLRILSETHQILKEIESTLSNFQMSMSSLLDLQHLSTLFKEIKSRLIPEYVICKLILKQVVKLHQHFNSLLNDYLGLILPDELTIKNVSILNDFNLFVSKNGYVLEKYAQYRTKWDKMVDGIFTNEEVELKECKEEEGEVSLDVQQGEDFIQSLTNFIKFINKVNVPNIKQFLESKISRLLSTKIFENIDSVIRNPQKMHQLKELMRLCDEATAKWNILRKFEGQGGPIESKLSKLHKEWMVDAYVDKVKLAMTQQPGAVKQVKQIKLDQSVEEEKEEEKEEDKEEEKEEEAAQVKDDGEDGWEANWDDGWDAEDDAASRTSKVDHAYSGRGDGVGDGGDHVAVTEIPEIIKPIIQEYQSHSSDISYLATAIKALAIVLYPSPKNSFLMYNDFKLMSRDLSADDSFSQFAEHTWNQVTIAFYSELKVLVSSLNLQSDEVLQDENLLDDYNMNQVGLIYRWFQILFEEKELQSTNLAKFKLLIVDLVDFINNYLLDSIIALKDIGETQCTIISLIIENLNNITIPYLTSLGISKDSIESFNKSSNVKYLLNNHLKDIMERFYQGELFDLSTEEIVQMIHSVFLPSELREGYVSEIREFRTMH
ncbi:uncharacterized protein LODBEIA_P16900 [Lodderomyces beijingensis]|uniref:Retrograde transport protein Dsl1 C-terminal domain-containing protein n=1 Tax=Lodderomyces beijingensis TaxID=1775926 RepID=A0ABP0ZH24_9ASCO